MHLIFTHENADFDAVAAMLGAHKLNPDARPILSARLNANVARFIILYRSALPFVDRDDIKSKKIERVTLVDTNRLLPFKGVRPTTLVHIIDHHALDRALTPNETFEGDTIGAATTLLVEQLQTRGIVVTPLEATLLALGIYEDTGSLAYRTTMPRDVRAAAWLLEQGAALDTVRQYLEPPLSDEQRDLFDALIAAAETRRISGYTVVIAATETSTYVDQLNAVAHRVRDTLDPHAVILLVSMPRGKDIITYIVCRSNDDAIDVSQIASVYGGGGHDRAASARALNRRPADLMPEIWTRIEQIIRPAVRVADLMSHGAQTVDAATPLRAVIGWMRRVGHEGYPVVDNGRVVGLLTRRDADRAAEHGLDALTVRAVMDAGDVTIPSEASVEALEQLMAARGWGQIPVVDSDGALIGIVTRTDLIQHWARTHPRVTPRPPAASFSIDAIARILGTPVSALIGLIVAHAQTRGVRLLLVGGVVRDLMLGQPSFDIDFVVESEGSERSAVAGAGITFAESLAAAYGGSIHAFAPFGTAKWQLAGAMLPIPSEDAPDHIDFATARSEFYEQPTALPTVFSGSVKLDLARRDFTINAMALQFSPESGASGQILDPFNGRADLRAKLMRVLHSLSFVDDPTRMLRALRFEARLDFAIEPRTAELMQTALPMLRRITGERVRNELTLLLRESAPEIALERMAARGILAAIHPDFRIADMDALKRALRSARGETLPFSLDAPLDLADLGWHLIGIYLPDDDGRAAVLERLLFGATKTESIHAAARIVRDDARLNDATTKISRACAILSDSPDVALAATWIALANSTLTRARIRSYAHEWQYLRPVTTGDTLRKMGLKPGRCYGIILEQLRTARLDGDIHTDADERRLIAQWVDEGLCE
ncbi:MAG: CBS domain-containing protein [Chloroflexota bacterium]|nr:CBS domain-containing protein [Chloroflexota bacterium]